MVDAEPLWEPPNHEYPPPKSGEPELHRAARVGDHTAIRQLVAAGHDLEEAFDLGLDPGAQAQLATPLMVAAGSGDGATADTVRLLLELEADPHCEVAEENAVSFCCRGLGWNYRPGGDLDRLRVLLEAGAPIPHNLKIATRMVADLAGRGDAARLREVLQRGAQANAAWQPADGELAAENMDRMMQQYASEIPDFFAGLPDDLREELRVTQEELDRQRARQIASAPYAFEIPLFRAAESGSADCVRLLIEFGADVTVRDNARQTALFHAGSAEVARLLVEGGLSTEDRDEFDWTPLAANVGDPARLRALIAAGANVNAVHDRGFTVLMSAAAEMGRSVEALRVLVEAGADPHAVTDLGWNAFHAALDVNGEANDEQSVRSVLGYLRQLGVDIELRNRAGQTPLARALLEGTALEVRTLCELGADVNATGPTSACSAQGCEVAESPLVFAAISGDLGASQKLEALLDAGAKTTVRDPQGRTLLEAARERRSENADYEPSDFRDALLLEMRKCLARLRAHR